MEHGLTADAGCLPAAEGSPKQGESAERTPLVERLTERELEVLRLIATGRSNRRIGGELYLALGTVKAHTHAIFGKLGAANRIEAIAGERELGLL